MTIRIGIVGCGRILAAHLRAYRFLREAGFDQFRITALCSRQLGDAASYVQRGAGPPQRTAVGAGDSDPLAVGDQYLSDFQDDVQPELFTDYQAMIRSGAVDAVNDFTSHEFHHQVASIAFAEGKHLLTQKPLAVSMTAALQMCDQADAAGCTFSVFENARFRPRTRHLRWLLDSGRIGRLKMISLTNVGNWWAPDLVVAGTPWRHRREGGGGLSLDIGVHLFHEFDYLAGPIDHVWGQVSIQETERKLGEQRVSCDADDSFICGFRSKQGVEGSMHLSWSGHGEPIMSGNGRGVCYYAERGSVIGDDVRLDDGSQHSLQTLYQTYAKELHETHFPRGIMDQFALNQLDWLQAIETGRAPETSGREGARDLAAALAILESDASGARVSVDDVFANKPTP